MSSDDEGEQEEAAVQKREEMTKWFKFCKDKIEKIEKVWNKKLEDESVVESDKEPSNDSEEQEKKEYEEELAKMFANFQEKTAEKVSKKDGRS